LYYCIILLVGISNSCWRS